MSSKNSITNLTRRNIFDYMSMEKILWAGRLDEPDFVARVWPDANEKPSYDGRFKGALADIHQHRVNNFDWEDDWIFTDGRFNLMSCSDEQFLAFLAEVVHPVVRSDDDEAADLVAEFNKHLRADGYTLAPGVLHQRPRHLHRFRRPRSACTGADDFGDRGSGRGSVLLCGSPPRIWYGLVARWSWSG